MSAGRHRGPILLLEAGMLFSGVGNGVALVVLPWLVLERTGSPTLVGVVSAAALVPLLISSVFAGTIVDIVGRRRTAVGADVLSGIAVAGDPDRRRRRRADRRLVDRLHHARRDLRSGWLHCPRDDAARPLRPGQDGGWDRVNGIHEAVFGVSFMIGPGLGGLLIAWVGPLDALWVTAVGFAVSALLTACVRGLAGAGRPESHAEVVTRLARHIEGFLFVWRQPALRSLALLSCAIVAAYLPFESVIFPVYFEAAGEPEKLGLIVTAMSAGGIVGALGPRPGRRLGRETISLRLGASSSAVWCSASSRCSRRSG